MAVRVFSECNIDSKLFPFTLSTLNNVLLYTGQLKMPSSYMTSSLKGFLGLFSILYQQCNVFFELLHSHKLYAVGSIGRSICEEIFCLEFMLLDPAQVIQRAFRFNMSTYQTTVSMSHGDEYQLLLKQGLLCYKSDGCVNVVTSRGAYYFNLARSRYLDSFSGMPIYDGHKDINMNRILSFELLRPGDILKDCPIDSTSWFDETGRIRTNYNFRKNRYGFGSISALANKVVKDTLLYDAVYQPLSRFVHVSGYDQMIERNDKTGELVYGKGYFNFEWLNLIFHRLVRLILCFNNDYFGYSKDVHSQIISFRSQCREVYGGYPEYLHFAFKGY